MCYVPRTAWIRIPSSSQEAWCLSFLKAATNLVFISSLPLLTLQGLSHVTQSNKGQWANKFITWGHQSPPEPPHSPLHDLQNHSMIESKSIFHNCVSFICYTATIFMKFFLQFLRGFKGWFRPPVTEFKHKMCPRDLFLSFTDELSLQYKKITVTEALMVVDVVTYDNGCFRVQYQEYFSYVSQYCPFLILCVRLVSDWCQMYHFTFGLLVEIRHFKKHNSSSKTWI